MTVNCGHMFYGTDYSRMICTLEANHKGVHAPLIILQGEANHVECELEIEVDKGWVYGRGPVVERFTAHDT